MTNLKALQSKLTESGWYEHLAYVIEGPDFQDLQNFLAERMKQVMVYPKIGDIFKAFYSPSFNDVKVVIMGQDPYNGAEQATGLAFAVPNGSICPPPLKNILQEVGVNCQGFPELHKTDLIGWQRQGVMLLNSILTVDNGATGSHKAIGWEELTAMAIAALSDRKEPVIFMLWGNYVQSLEPLIDYKRHAILKAPYPTQNGFFGCRHFRQANDILIRMGKTPINWLET